MRLRRNPALFLIIPVKHHLPSFALVTTLTVFLFASASAQIVVKVGALPAVSVPNFAAAGGAEAAAIVRADLKHTSEVDPLASGTAPYALTATVAADSITATLTKRGAPAPLFSQAFPGNYRAAAHLVSDAVVQAMTGRPGFASSKIAFIGTSGSKELYLADIDGFGAHNVTSDHVICSCPNFSHDGHWLAYTSYKSGYADAYTINLATGKRTRIAYFPGINSGAAFSPDGTRIALTLSKDGNPEIYTIASTGGGPVRITNTRGAESSPCYSPAGDRLLFSSDDRGTPQLYTTSALGGPLELVHTLQSFCTKPDWSPDGTQIAFTTRISGQFQIAVYTFATSSTTLVTSSGGQDPCWTRDSRHLVYDFHGQLSLLDTVTKVVTPIPLAISASEPAVSP